MAALQWARLQADVNCQLRRGAWYRVVRLAPMEAVVEVVKGKPTPVPRDLIRISVTPACTWTVVPRPARALRLPASWGDVYGVCPNCRHRAPLEDRPTKLRCQRCNGFFAVAWDERYLASA